MELPVFRPADILPEHNPAIDHDDDRALIVITDDGAGLTDNDKERLFGRFKRLSAKPTAGEASTGLGLSIVKRIVELHGGKVSAQNHPDGGLLVRLELPIETVPSSEPRGKSNSLSK
jgi:signal transduction histidine kinase